MNFQPDLAAKVLDGSKTVTRRLVNYDNPRSYWWHEKCRYKVGQRFTINPGRGKVNIGRAIVREVDQGPLGHLLVCEAEAEGFRTPTEFEAAFAAINGSYDPDCLVWRIVFVAERDGARI